MRLKDWKALASIVISTYDIEAYYAWREWNGQYAGDILEWIETYPFDEPWQKLMNSPSGRLAWQLNRIYRSFQPTLISIDLWKGVMAGQQPTWFFFDTLGRE